MSGSKKSNQHPSASVSDSKVGLLPLNQAFKVKVSRLKLDNRNPRLFSMNEGSSEGEIIQQLFISEDLEELLQSIAANGYLDIEPLVVMRDRSDGMYIVLEGNRRLSAIKLLSNPLLARVADDTYSSNDRFHRDFSSRVPKIDEQFRKTLEEVSVYRVENRDAARSFIGFKHINGPAKWSSYAKARFASEWYRSNKTSLEEIALKIGDRHDTVTRMVVAIYVLDQAKNMGIYSTDDIWSVRFNFSHLYTALSRTQFREYLGLTKKMHNANLRKDPVPKAKIAHLREVLLWIYGSKADDKKPLVRAQNPDLKRLGDSLQNKQAVDLLRVGASLDEAFESTQPIQTTFTNALRQARRAASVALLNLRGFDRDKRHLIDLAEDVFSSASLILKGMKDKAENHTDQVGNDNEG